MLYIGLQQRRVGSLNIKDYLLLSSKKTYYLLSKEFSTLLFMGRYKSLGSLNSFLSYAPQLSGAESCFLFLF